MRDSITHINAVGKKQYYDLVEGTPDLLSRVDLGGRILFANHAARAGLGIPAAGCRRRRASVSERYR